MVIYLPVKFEFDWTKSFQRKKTDKNGQTNRWNQFRKEPSYDDDLPVKFEFDWTKRFQVRVRKRKC